MLLYTQTEPQLINPVSKAFTCENESQLVVRKVGREECGWNQVEKFQTIFFTLLLNIIFYLVTQCTRKADVVSPIFF